MANPTNSDCYIAAFIAIVTVCAMTPVTQAQQNITLGLGTAWGLPGVEIFDESPPLWSESNTIPGDVSVSQFNPAWGTLNTVQRIIEGSASYTWDIDWSPVGGGAFPAFQQGVGFYASITASDNIFFADTKSGNDGPFNGPAGVAVFPPQSGTIDLGPVSANQFLPTAPFIGTGLYTLHVEHTVATSGCLDQLNSNVCGWTGHADGGINGIYSGIMMVIYNFTPATPPPPGDANMDGSVGIADFSILNQNFGMAEIYTGWNHGDFDNDQDVDLNDYVALLSSCTTATDGCLLQGDANKDGMVTGADLVSVQQNFGKTGQAGGSLIGDANASGSVTGSDLITVMQNQGAALGSGSAPVGVPEPATFALMTLTTALSLRPFRGNWATVA